MYCHVHGSIHGLLEFSFACIQSTSAKRTCTITIDLNIVQKQLWNHVAECLGTSSTVYFKGQKHHEMKNECHALFKPKTRSWEELANSDAEISHQI